jgi:hypothetical protein
MKMAYVGWEGTALSRRPKGIVGYTRSTEAHQQHKSIRSGRRQVMAWARRERAKKRGEV